MNMGSPFYGGSIFFELRVFKKRCSYMKYTTYHVGIKLFRAYCYSVVGILFLSAPALCADALATIKSLNSHIPSHKKNTYVVSIENSSAIDEIDTNIYILLPAKLTEKVVTPPVGSYVAGVPGLQAGVWYIPMLRAGETFTLSIPVEYETHISANIFTPQAYISCAKNIFDSTQVQGVEYLVDALSSRLVCPLVSWGIQDIHEYVACGKTISSSVATGITCSRSFVDPAPMENTILLLLSGYSENLGSALAITNFYPSSLNSGYSEITLNFDAATYPSGVANVVFGVFDIDSDKNFIDHILVQGVDVTGATVYPYIEPAHASCIGVTGPGVMESIAALNVAPPDLRGAAMCFFRDSLKSVTIRYSNTYSKRGMQSIFISDIYQDCSAGLSLKASTYQDEVDCGETFSYILNVENHGSTDQTNVVVNDLYLAGLTSLSAMPEVGTFDALTGVWSVGTLSPGGSKEIIVSGVVESFPSGGLVQGVPHPASDTLPADPLASGVAIGVLVRPCSYPDVSASLSQVAPTCGESFTYTITLVNNGGGEATNVKVWDLVPDGLVFDSATPGAGTTFSLSNGGTWDVGTIASAATVSLTIAARFSDLFDDTAVVVRPEVSLAEQDSNPSNNGSMMNIYAPMCAPTAMTGSHSTFINENLEASLKATAGVFVQSLSYSQSVEAVNGRVVIDPLTGDFTYTPNTDFVGSDSFTFQVADVDDPSLFDSAVISIDVLAASDERISIEAAKNFAEANDSNIYYVYIENISGSTIVSADVQVTLPVEAIYLSDNGGGNYNSSAGVWHLDNLTAGEKRRLDISVTYLDAPLGALSANVSLVATPAVSASFDIEIGTCLIDIAESSIYGMLSHDGARYDEKIGGDARLALQKKGDGVGSATTSSSVHLGDVISIMEGSSGAFEIVDLPYSGSFDPYDTTNPFSTDDYVDLVITFDETVYPEGVVDIGFSLFHRFELSPQNAFFVWGTSDSGTVIDARGKLSSNTLLHASSTNPTVYYTSQDAAFEEDFAQGRTDIMFVRPIRSFTIRVYHQAPASQYAQHLFLSHIYAIS
jgi:uncharacterized repeat protein (TIGR01451 family)